MAESQTDPAGGNTPPLQVVSFRLFNEVYALDILYVQEIIRMLPVTHVPRAAEWIAGVINLRGQIIPLIRLASRLGLDVEQPGRNTRFMIVRGRDQGLGLIVDEVLEVLRLSPQVLEPPPSHLAHRDYIQAVSKQERGLVIVLDPQKILYHPSRHEALQEAL
ncbi:MAG: chemotaxis protein CheW [Candidatus Melainabacteria bacterium HGW-Melainabacteria-1]|nr:MAG: chemotaxis protein CheW [Candidatus Melainabacteria bacterium HGW-Melainabacteria-1]